MQNPRPHRPYQRFKSATVANSGTNPNGGFLEFIKKDATANIDVHRDARPAPPDIQHMATKFAVGTMKYTARTGKITDEGRLDRTQIGKPTTTWARNPTDNISFEPPAVERPFQKVFDEIVTKQKYNINAVSKNGWVPYHGGVNSKTVNNRSSVAHNIISFQKNEYAQALVVGLLDKNVTNMKKGIGEFTDLQRVTAINKNPEFLKAIADDGNLFKRKNGIFTYLYDSAARFGETKPFKH